MRLRRAVLAVAAVTALAAANTSHAALDPQITDPKGDSKVGAANDILKVTFDTVKVKKVIKEFIIKVELAAPPAVSPVATYNIGANIGGCGTLLVYSYWGALDGGPSHRWTARCGPDTGQGPRTTLHPKVTIKGNTLTYSVPFKSMPKEMQRKGFAFTDLYAYTAPGDPVYGITPADFIAEPGANDWAQSTKIFKMG